MAVIVDVPIPDWLARPLLRVRSWLQRRERVGVVEQARRDAQADVGALFAAEGLDAVRASLAPGRARRGWDGARHLPTIPERQRSRYSRAYYVASRDRARELVAAGRGQR